ncbi:MAG: IPT/TIG domain-containing protein [Thermoanaerobaculaceae bacterium]
MEARATVRQGSAAVPDGTPVTFSVPQQSCWYDKNKNGQQEAGETGLCYWFLENNLTSITKETSNGVASAVWTSGVAGDVTVSAATGSANASATVRFLAVEGPTESPRFTAITPGAGSARGGYQVTLSGQWLCKSYLNGNCAVPATVTMKQAYNVGTDVTVEGSTVTIVTNTVNREVTLTVVSAAGNGQEDRLVLTIPPADVGFLTDNVKVDLTIDNGSSPVLTVASAFEYQRDYIKAGQPQIFGVSPNQGTWRGGEEILITGENLCVLFSATSGLCEERFKPLVSLNPPGAPAEITWVSPDGRALRVRVPSLGATPPDNIQASVNVTNAKGTNSLPNGFVYQTDSPTPQLFALMPNAGPVEGGTRVTIFGTGFQAPVQVLFGDRQAQVISSNYNEIVCIAPSIAPSGPSTPTVVNVTVTNILTGKTSSNALAYRYGEAMFVSGISPTQGYIFGWTPATIYGQGFVAPVQVLVTAANITKEAQVLSVSGTSIEVKMPPFSEAVGTECTPTLGVITVTNLGSNLTATGPTFTYVCSPLSGP